MGIDPITHENTINEIDALRTRLEAAERDMDGWRRSSGQYLDTLNNLTKEIRERLQPYFPTNSRALDTDVLPRTIEVGFARIAELVKAVEGLMGAVAAYLGAVDVDNGSLYRKNFGGPHPIVGENRRFLDAALAAADAVVSDIQPCGHPRSAIVSTDEGTHHCGACEKGGG